MKIVNLIVNTFKDIGRNLVAQKQEPLVQFKRDSYGNSYWQVDDPINNKSYAFDSDRDVRVWIEQRHHSA
ncbi:conserved hypothetical protein [Hyella patelloides LEGE 07179]|uniref:Uncharacterized protein n=1 Tax=Hyella patelloides LEGE 07179 TaxID=945734 RepID=A0A563VY15_9CYAN|nr:hypothetical protein [Hyella patelloides]VEP16348.1 conserved hypothetical protein [Hyella patelloides LEGE 07179]